MSPKRIKLWIKRGDDERIPKDPRTKAIVDRLKRGDKYKAIAADFQISEERVRQIRVYAGLPARHEVLKRKGAKA